MTELLTALSVMFIVAGPFLLIANRFDLPTVPGFILAGLIAGLFIDENITQELARWGIALLVFMFGARIRPEVLRTALSDSELAAITQVLVLGGLGFAVGLLFVPADQAIYLGVAAAFSSTIVGTALLQTDIRKDRLRGRLAESIQFVQDLVAIVVVLVLGAEAATADAVATELGYGVVLLVAAVFVYRYVFVVFQRIAGDSDELMIIGVIALLAMFLGAAELAEVSIVVGSFAAGLAIRADSAESLGLANGLESIHDFFIAIFFVTVGTLVAIPSFDVLLMALLLGVLTAVVKPAVMTAILIYQGYEGRSATLTSLSLDQVSEFALIIAIEALILGLIVQDVFDAIILAAAATMITSTLSRRFDEQIYRVLADRVIPESRHLKVDRHSAVPEDMSDHIVIVGYGRQGQYLRNTCETQNIPYVVVENDPLLLDEMESECESYVFGDAVEPYVWEKARVTEARLVLSTVDSTPVSRRLLSLTDGTDVILRSDSAPTALEFLESGALYVAVSGLLASERLVEHIDSILSGEIAPEELREKSLPSGGGHGT